MRTFEEEIINHNNLQIYINVYSFIIFVLFSIFYVFVLRRENIKQINYV